MATQPSSNLDEHTGGTTLSSLYGHYYTPTTTRHQTPYHKRTPALVTGSAGQIAGVNGPAKSPSKRHPLYTPSSYGHTTSLLNLTPHPRLALPQRAKQRPVGVYVDRPARAALFASPEPGQMQTSSSADGQTRQIELSSASPSSPFAATAEQGFSTFSTVDVGDERFNTTIELEDHVGKKRMTPRK
ncbi:Hypothetical protein D9617_58g048320 [Elsinoe fawcettii]|nr:Hypothetical protein D9617_58g048320 [Elsinoe fawcettii]